MTTETKIAIVAIGLIGLYIFTQKDGDKEDATIKVEFRAMKGRLVAVENQVQRMERRGPEEITAGDCEDWLLQLEAIRKEAVGKEIFERLAAADVTVGLNKERFDAKVGTAINNIRLLGDRCAEP